MKFLNLNGEFISVSRAFFLFLIVRVRNFIRNTDADLWIRTHNTGQNKYRYWSSLPDFSTWRASEESSWNGLARLLCPMNNIIFNYHKTVKTLQKRTGSNNIWFT